MARVYPPMAEWESLRTPLTPGERALAMYFADSLDDEWCVYVQAHMNGRRPDLVLVHPSRGVMIWEVKDWRLDAYRCSRDRQNASRWKWFVAGDTAVRSPFQQVTEAKQALMDVLVPEFGELVSANSKAFGVVRCGVYFHRASTKAARAKAGDEASELYAKCIGRDALDGYVERLIPLGRKSPFMTADLAERVHAVCRPPYHHGTIGECQPQGGQARHAQPAIGFHRLRGVAGSGKSFVLAHRAAAHAALGHRVLVVSYHHTMTNLLHDFLRRTPYSFDPSLIDTTHFHGLCRWLAPDAVDGDEISLKPAVPLEPAAHKALQRLQDPATIAALPGRNRHQQIAKDAAIAVANGCVPAERFYDAVLIDEGQGFTQTWFDICASLVREGGDLLLVYDKAQNIHNRDLSWCEGPMQGFAGRWGKLTDCWRMCGPIRDLAVRFAQHHDLPTDRMEPPEAGGDMFAATVATDQQPIWRDFSPWQAGIAEDALMATLADLIRERGAAHISDIVAIVPTHTIGMRIEQRIREKLGVRTTAIFEEAEANGIRPTRRKRAFWMGDGGLKLCTPHSFQGWELHTVVVLVTPQLDFARSRELLYTALTRARRRLIVLNARPELSPYAAADSCLASC